MLVPGAGIEPARCHHRGTLSPVRLPIPPSRQRKTAIMTDFGKTSKSLRAILRMPRCDTNRYHRRLSEKCRGTRRLLHVEDSRNSVGESAGPAQKRDPSFIGVGGFSGMGGVGGRWSVIVRLRSGGELSCIGGEHPSWTVSGAGDRADGFHHCAGV